MNEAENDPETLHY